MLRIVCVSDTHNQHWKLPALPLGDVLIHAGDFSGRGSQREILDFNNWLGDQPHQYKIVIPGNHDRGLHESWSTARALLRNATHVLNDSGCEVEGRKFWGSPWTPEFEDWAFGYTEREGQLRWTQIPEGLDVLITHGPPHGVLDEIYDKYTKRKYLVGCPSLREQVFNRAKPRHHVFGHIHEGYGSKVVDNVVCHNVSILDESYQVTNAPTVFDL